LAPIVVENLFAALLAIRDNAGVTMILAEQKVDLALAFAEDHSRAGRGERPANLAEESLLPPSARRAESVQPPPASMPARPAQIVAADATIQPPALQPDEARIGRRSGRRWPPNARGTESLQTPCWREMDSNFRSREGVTLCRYSGESFSPKKIASVKQLTHPSTPARFRCGAIPG
jgi:hypothetical protein